MDRLETISQFRNLGPGELMISGSAFKQKIITKVDSPNLIAI